MKQENKVTLESHEGGANKQYTLWLEKNGKGWMVNFQYGPIGGWVKGGAKNKKPVSREKAEKIYAELINKKKAKGYVEGEDAPAFSQSPDKVDSGVRLMLLTKDVEENLEFYIMNPAWAGQQKMNGKRTAIKAANGKVIGINKTGLVCPIPQVFKKVFKGATVTPDGELIGTTYYVFDVLEGVVGDHRDEPLDWRDDLAHSLVQSLNSEYVKKVPLVKGEEAKRALVEKLRKGKKEGVVFKRLDALYEPGKRPNLKKALAVKIKFYAEIAAVVLEWNEGKQSVKIGAREELEGDEMQITVIGNVTVHDKYVDQIVVGKPLRVKYLYATDARKLFQPKLDPTDDGQVMADQTMADPITDLKYEGKDD